MLRNYFPNTNEAAELYGGYLFENNIFHKVYDFPDTFDAVLKEINIFLKENGYKEAAIDEFDETHTYQIYPVSISPHAYQIEMVLSIEKDGFALTQSECIINELKKFRDVRNWEKFHNPKDLAIALNIEANELLGQFLWKKTEEADKEKIKEQLADVFSYALLLADKMKLDMESIVLQKIKSNNEKYPIDISSQSPKVNS